MVPSRQRYEHLSLYAAGGASVRYSSGTFRSDLQVDADGFVLVYPTLAVRLDADPADAPLCAAGPESARPSDPPART